MEQKSVPWSIKIISIFLIIVFSYLSLLMVGMHATYGASIFYAIFTILFVIGAIGLFKLKKWSFWLIITLCVVGILNIVVDFLKIFDLAGRYPAANNAEVYGVVVAFFLGIAIFLVSRRNYFENDEV